MRFLEGDLDVWCAVCERPVERVTVFPDPLVSGTRVRAQCHGQLAEATIRDELVVDAESITPQRWVAFEKNLLSPPPKALAEDL